MDDMVLVAGHHYSFHSHNIVWLSSETDKVHKKVCPRNSTLLATMDFHGRAKGVRVKQQRRKVRNQTTFYLCSLVFLRRRNATSFLVAIFGVAGLSFPRKAQPLSRQIPFQQEEQIDDQSPPQNLQSLQVA